MKHQIVVGLILLACGMGIRTQDLPSTPILTLELGQHRAKLTGVSTDAANRFLVTSCEDKTARVWDLSTGKLLSTLRPPAANDDDKDGMLYTAAISPDGAKIAVGGWTGPEWNSSIYIFDRESGRIEKRLPNLRQVVNNLKFSRDGNYLAAILGGKEGLRVYETRTFDLIYSDKDYGAQSLRVDFSSDNRRLATSSSDGFVRLYSIASASIAPAAKTRITDIKFPFAVAFSPSDDRIAVGGYKSDRVALIGTLDFKVISYLIPPSVEEIDLSSVAWSPDGQTLYAGGIYYSTNNNQIVYWTGSEQTFGAALVSKRRIQDMAALSNGIVFGHARPSWGRLNSKDEQVQFVDSVIPNYGSNPTGLLVNDNLSAWQFSSSNMPRSPISFSLGTRELTFGRTPNSQLSPPLVSGKSIKVSDCCNGSEVSPTVNGRTLLLDEYEKTKAFTLLPDEKSLLLATGWYLRFFTKDGELVWKTSIPSPAVAVNVSASGRIALVVCADGTVRWYRTSDGKELLAFYAPEDESGRWILWTPSGYYDASLNAEDLLGWTVNNGRDAAADFFPNHLFRAYFYRPDVIDRILDTLDESVAVNLANKKAGRNENDLTIAKILPPVLDVNLPKSKEVSDSTVTINYAIRSHTNEPITAVKIFLDGKQTKSITSTPNQKGKNVSTITINVPRRNTELMLTAENRFTTGVPVKIQLKWRGKS